jgi:hypothetical protein
VENAAWFKTHLGGSAEAFAWAARDVPEERRLAAPPPGLGEWSAARHVFHLVVYESAIAQPSMRQWLGEPAPDLAGMSEELAWQSVPRDYEAMLDAFRVVRGEQLDLLDAFSPDGWQEIRRTIWGDVSLHWVVSKTYQHTAEHISDVMRIALFWDSFARQQARAAAR